ncbi:MAG TPA: hypothetical protein VGB97_02465 [Candidatus Paceibacterota bacterium]|jgi:hypothetical protein
MDIMKLLKLLFSVGGIGTAAFLAGSRLGLDPGSIASGYLGLGVLAGMVLLYTGGDTEEDRDAHRAGGVLCLGFGLGCVMNDAVFLLVCQIAASYVALWLIARKYATFREISLRQVTATAVALFAMTAPVRLLSQPDAGEGLDILVALGIAFLGAGIAYAVATLRWENGRVVVF